MRYRSPRTITFIVFVVLVVGGFLIGRLNPTSGSVSSEFREARLQGALISQEIVALSNQLAGDLAAVNDLDQQARLSEALKLTQELITKTEDVKARAAQLSEELAKMTSGLSTVTSQEARQAALESITDRMAILSRLLSYSEYLKQLLVTLQARFSGAKTSVEVRVLIDQVNAEVGAINNFDRQATEAMTRFDEIIR